MMPSINRGIGFNAVRYLLKSGCQWRMLPKEYPARATVHYAFPRWATFWVWCHARKRAGP